MLLSWQGRTYAHCPLEATPTSRWSGCSWTSMPSCLRCWWRRMQGMLHGSLSDASVSLLLSAAPPSHRASRSSSSRNRSEPNTDEKFESFSLICHLSVINRFFCCSLLFSRGVCYQSFIQIFRNCSIYIASYDILISLIKGRGSKFLSDVSNCWMSTIY